MSIITQGYNVKPQGIITQGYGVQLIEETPEGKVVYDEPTQICPYCWSFIRGKVRCEREFFSGKLECHCPFCMRKLLWDNDSKVWME